MWNSGLKNLNISARIGCAVIGLLMLAAMPIQAACPDSEGNRGLEGHWVVTITSGLGHRFVTLVTFTPKGDIEVFANREQTTSIGRGTYCRTGDRQFTLAFVQLDYAQSFLVTGRSIITLNRQGDQFTGPNNVEVLAIATGQVVFEGNDGSVIGKLVQP